MTDVQEKALRCLADPETKTAIIFLAERAAIQDVLDERAELLAACVEFLASPGGSAREARALVAMREVVARAKGGAA